MNLPAAAKFMWGDDGAVHIMSTFGDAWHEDVVDPNTGDYWLEVSLESSAEEPDDITGLCRGCYIGVDED